MLSVQSFGEVVGPLAEAVGSWVSRLFGVTEDLALRLRRCHSPLDVTAFRMRQLAWSAAGLAGGLLLVAAVRPPLAVTTVLILGTPLLAFLVVEQRTSAAASQWQRRIFLELPVVSEQLAMLIAAGYSLGSAMNRISSRGCGACAQDLAWVCNRVRQGLTDVAALREWAAIAQIDALDRLVAILALNTEAADLGRLVSDEARSIRRDVQRQTMEVMERRSQQVWVPVTVATLVPGVIFLAIPFIQALRLFSGS
jgi:Flp pilus assembly protein TadB